MSRDPLAQPQYVFERAVEGLRWAADYLTRRALSAASPDRRVRVALAGAAIREHLDAIEREAREALR